MSVPLAALVLLAALLHGCSGADEAAVREVHVDGGTESLIAVRGVNVLAEPGDVLRIRNANHGPEGRAAAEDDHGGDGTVVHAFTTAAEDALPPLFVEGGGGVLPNAGIWGACQGGRADAAVGTCPIPPIEGPEAWDGEVYWSTGAMLPTESRDVPLADDIPLGTHRLVCALHPELFIDVIVTDDVGAPDPPDAAPPPAAPEAILPDDLPAGPSSGQVVVAPSGNDTVLTRYHPSTLEIAVGDPVTWSTTTRAPHDVVLGAEEQPELEHSTPEEGLPDLPDGAWDGTSTIRSGFMSTDPSAPGGTTMTVTFDAAGTYQYHCRFHPSMTGTVVVR